MERRAQRAEAARATRAHVPKFRSEATEAETSRAGEMGRSVEFEGGLECCRRALEGSGGGGSFINIWSMGGRPPRLWWFTPACGAGIGEQAVEKADAEEFSVDKENCPNGAALPLGADEFNARQ